MSSELRFDGQVALVTGAAKGIARDFALLLARRGAKVVVNGNYRPSGSGPEEDVAAEIRSAGGDAIGFNGSVVEDESCRAMIAAAVDTFGRLDVLVNSAGTGDATCAIQDAPMPIMDEQFAIHIKGPMQLFRAAIPHFQKAGGGRVLNFGSATAFGFKGMQGWGGSYPIVKAATWGMTRQMAGFGKEHDIKVNLIMPMSHTDAVERIWKGTDFNEWWKRNLAADKVAAAGLFLLHRDCPTTGEFITTAGGRVARVLLAEPEGIFDPDLTPERVRDRWQEIMGDEDEKGFIDHVMNIDGQSREYSFVKNLIDIAAAR
jgi:NAD(P)-dependent dehydrogenase (short-subunit alcohol dehydrogenase family)